jgi:N-acetylglutamate synthase/N-acetylornithine aminotransferase
MATKQEVADYINANYESVWTAEEEAKIDQMLNPELATILIKLVGDVSFLTEVRDNASNKIMAYKINNTFGTLLVTLADGTIDVATTDLTLIGKGYAGFGEKLNENLVKLLENFNNTSAPTNKQQGQLWYDKTNKQINVYTGSKWKPVGSTTNSATHLQRGTGRHVV